MSYLRDSLFVTGNEKAEFFTLCKEIDDGTRYIVVKKGEDGVRIMPCNATSADEIEYLESANAARTLQFSAMNGNSDLEAAYNEAVASRAPAIRFPDGTAAISTNRAIAEIGAANSLHGAALMVPCKERDAYMEHLSRKTDLTYILRTDNAGMNKVMSVRTGKYQPIPLASIEDVLYAFLDTEEIGSYKTAYWAIDQDEADIYIEFPDLAEDLQAAYPNIRDKFVPAVRFRNGTTGYSTLAAQMCFRRDGCDRYHLLNETAAKHFKCFDAQAFANKVQTEIWAKFTQMPAKLAEATQVYLDASNFTESLDKILKFVHIKKVFQCKESEKCPAADKIRANVSDYCEDIMRSYGVLTVYDLIDAVMTIPDRVTVPDSYRDLLAKQCDTAWQFPLS